MKQEFTLSEKNPKYMFNNPYLTIKIENKNDAGNIILKDVIAIHEEKYKLR